MRHRPREQPGQLRLALCFDLAAFIAASALLALDLHQGRRSTPSSFWANRWRKKWPGDVSHGACHGMKVRKILRASALIPRLAGGVFDVEVDGKKFQEMRVDGGAIARLFLDPRSVDISASGVHVLVLHGRGI